MTTEQLLERELEPEQVEALREAARHNREPLREVLRDAVTDYLAWRAQCIASAHANHTRRTQGIAS